MTDKKVTTKKCPVCGNTQLGLLSQIDGGLKVCVDHNPFVYIPWKLDKGQKPLV